MPGWHARPLIVAVVMGDGRQLESNGPTGSERSGASRPRGAGKGNSGSHSLNSSMSRIR